MRLQHVNAELYGWLSLADQVEPVTVWRGPNESGKTSMLKAVRYALHGPERGELDGSWYVALDFRDGPNIVRERTASGRTELLLDGFGGGIREQQRLVETAVGRGGSWTLGGFLKKSAAEQLRILRDGVLADMDVDVETELADLAEDLDAVWADWEADPQAGQKPGPWRTLALDVIVDSMAVRWQALNQTAIGLGKALKQNARDAARSDSTEDVPGTVASWRAKKDALQAEYDELNRSYGEAQGAGRARAELELQLESLTQKHAGLQDEIEAAGDPAARGRTLLVAQVAAEGKLKTAQDKVDGLEACAPPFPEPWNQMQIGALDRVRWAINEGMLEASAHETLLDGLRYLDLAAEHRETWHAAIAERNDASFAYDTARQAVDEAAGALSRLRKHQAELQRVEQEIERVRTSLDELVLTPTEALTEAMDVTREEMARCDRAIDVLNDRVQAQQARIDMARRKRRAEATRTQIGEIGKLLRERQAEALRRCLLPLVEPATAFLAPLGLRPHVTIDSALQLFVERQGFDRVPWGLAAHSVRAVVSVALQVAIREQLGGWRYVIMDDLETLEPARLDGMLGCVQRAIDEDRLDNFLGAQVHSAPPPERAHVIALDLPLGMEE